MWPSGRRAVKPSKPRPTPPPRRSPAVSTPKPPWSMAAKSCAMLRPAPVTPRAQRPRSTTRSSTPRPPWTGISLAASGPCPVCMMVRRSPSHQRQRLGPWGRCRHSIRIARQPRPDLTRCARIWSPKAGRHNRSTLESTGCSHPVRRWPNRRRGRAQTGRPRHGPASQKDSGTAGIASLTGCTISPAKRASISSWRAGKTSARVLAQRYSSEPPTRSVRASAISKTRRI
ncbi:Uncharacterised protein [Mycobacteroides abscessus subsp. abscessus]|nr:Uncharacterised protein [Mycobacteroides abscessus subsp. abscessus]SKW33452.1 Uncharacterised protein [Mycobacteroides abscessus subsp. abscessus]